MAITLDGNNLTTVGLINSATAVASTSGTSIDFTNIPSGVKRITVVFNGVSTNGSSIPLLQIGAGSILSSGYVGTTGYGLNAGASVAISQTTGFGLDGTSAAGSVIYGSAVLTTVGSNIWVFSMAGTATGGTPLFLSGGGAVTLSGTLDRVRITTVNGTDTFDAGSINILYE